MEWLLNEVDARIARLSPDLFAHLRDARSRDDLGWVYQLAHMSRGFIQSLCLRVANCGLRHPSDCVAYYRSFTVHARAEISHPLEFEDWMRKTGFLGSAAAFCDSSATAETRELLDYCRKVASVEPPEVQVVVMNVVAEGVAYRFFGAASAALSRLEIASGRFWRDHEGDLEHARIGVEEVGDVVQGSELGIDLQRCAERALDLFDGALASWVTPR